MSGPPVWEQRYRAPAVWFPVWSSAAPERLVYLSSEGGSRQAWAWDRADGPPGPASSERVGVSSATVTAAGDSVVWFSDTTGAEAGCYVVRPFGGGESLPLLPGVPEGWPGGAVAGRRVVAVGRSADDGFSVHAAADGGPARELARHDCYVGLPGADGPGAAAGALSADETLLCLEHAEHGDLVRTALRVVDPLTGAVVGDQWDGDGFGIQAAAWSPVRGDARLAIVHELDGWRRPAVWSPATGERRNLELDLDADVDVLGWWPDARSLLLVAHKAGRDSLVRLPLDGGEPESLEHGAGTISGAAVRPDGDVWYRLASGAEPPRVLDGAGAPVLAVEHGPPPGRPYRSWWFENPAGERVHGFYATPPGGGPFPVVMWVHGGPSWLYADDWNPDVQAFVDHGFAVGMVNYRGSTGYGVAWRDRLVGDIGFPELEDVLAGLDDLVRRGVADPARAVVGGYSWGGYVTLLMLGRHPDRFAAGVAGVPVGDYAACYVDLSPPLQAYDRYLLGGTIEEKAELVRERSPITYVDRVRTPVLCLIGENDTRCPPRQAYRYVEALRERGGQVEVYAYDAGHASYVVDEEVRQMGAILDFLRRRLGG